MFYTNTKSAHAATKGDEAIEEIYSEVIQLLWGNLGAKNRVASPRKTRKATVTPKPATKQESALDLQLDVLNSDIDWLTMLPRLQKNVSGSFCFYGPPGSGKTAMAKQIAKHLGRPLMLRKGSDFLDKHVGETEAKIQSCFAEAKRKRAVLLIDEVDGLLLERSGSSHSWERTQVNQLLCEMEDFKGLFICTTNHFGSLDSATMRRFSLKCEFRPMTAEQAWLLFMVYCKKHLGEDTTLLPKKEALRPLLGLCPGDFVAAEKRLLLFDNTWQPLMFYQQLQAELPPKSAPKRSIGFV